MSLGLAVVSTAFALFVVVALWCGLLQRVLIAGGILREAADCVASMPSILLLLPPLLIFGLSVLFTYWICIAMLLASAGIPSRGFMHYDRRLQWLFVAHTIGLLWSVEVLLHLGFCACAGAAVRWYFASIDTATVSLGGCGTVCGALRRTLRFSCGSLVLGAVLVVPGRCLRFFLEHCLHQAQTDGRGKPEMRLVTSCCLRCCLDCSARFVQYLSHNAYVLVAAHDLSFCEGARQAFELTMRNIGEVALLTAGERLLLTLAKLAICCACTAGAAFAIGTEGGVLSVATDNANGALILIFCATFCVADAWIHVYDAAVEAVFLCFLVDHEENDGETRPYYASPLLVRYMEGNRPSCRVDDPDPDGYEPPAGCA